MSHPSSGRLPPKPKKRDNFEELLRELDKEISSKPPDGTSTILVADLEAKLVDTTDAAKSALIREIIARARRYEYDDFKSLHMAPKLLLKGHLENAGLPDLVRKVIQGVYDSR